MRSFRLLAPAGLWVSLCLAPTAAAQVPLEPSAELDLGYRRGEFNWNIAGTLQGTDPNVLSELDWTGLGVLEVRVGGEVVAWRHLWLGGSYRAGTIRSGDNRDSDYLGDDRTLEFSRTDNAGDEGRVRDAEFGVGYMFRFPATVRRGALDLLLAAGYAQARQDLRLLDGFQTIADEDIFGEPLPTLGPFEGLDSSYDARWDGTWVGVEGRWAVSPRSALRGRLRFHRADFEAEANWNLRDDFAHPVSFAHSADGDGLGVRVAYLRGTQTRWGWQLSLDYQRWTTDAGVDRVFFDDGTSVDTRLNEATWSSVALSLGITVGRRR